LSPIWNWNALLDSVDSASSVASFQHHLKLFCSSDNSVVSTLVDLAVIIIIIIIIIIKIRNLYSAIVPLGGYSSLVTPLQKILLD